MTSEEDTAKKALIATVIEEKLLDISRPLYETVVTILKKQYGCYLPDCYEHPEYLAEILKELYGSSYPKIAKSINEELAEFSYCRTITRFLEVTNNPRNMTLEIEQRLHSASQNILKIRESLRKGNWKEVVEDCLAVHEDLKELKNLKH